MYAKGWINPEEMETRQACHFAGRCKNQSSRGMLCVPEGSGDQGWHRALRRLSVSALLQDSGVSGSV